MGEELTTALETDDDPIEAEGVRKIRDNRARRMAARQGYRLMKSRRRDPRSISYGEYQIVDPDRKAIVAGELDSPWSLSLEEVEAWLQS
jgi:hypothetical protein